MIKEIIEEIKKLKTGESLDMDILCENLNIDMWDNRRFEVTDILNTLCNLNLNNDGYNYVKVTNNSVKLYTSIEDVMVDIDILRRIARENYFIMLDGPLPYKFSNPISHREKRQIITKIIHSGSYIATNGRVGPTTHMLVGKEIYQILKDVDIIDRLDSEIIITDKLDDYEFMCIRIFEKEYLINNDKWVNTLKGRYQVCGFIAEPSEKVEEVNQEDRIKEREEISPNIINKFKKFLGLK